MSFVVTAVATVGPYAAAASLVYSAYSANQANKREAHAMDLAQQRAKIQEDMADQANNRANAKRPNIGALLAANQRAAASGGGAGTMLTGASGVDPSLLTLGRTSLLGL